MLGDTIILKHLRSTGFYMHIVTGFWGGLVPENAFNASALEDLLNAGVLGLKVNTLIE